MTWFYERSASMVRSAVRLQARPVLRAVEAVVDMLQAAHDLGLANAARAVAEERSERELMDAQIARLAPPAPRMDVRLVGA